MLCYVKYTNRVIHMAAALKQSVNMYYLIKSTCKDVKYDL